MTDLQHLPRLPRGRRQALEGLGVHDADDLLAFAGAAVAGVINQQRARTYMRPQDAAGRLVAAVTGEHAAGHEADDEPVARPGP